MIIVAAVVAWRRHLKMKEQDRQFKEMAEAKYQEDHIY